MSRPANDTASFVLFEPLSHTAPGRTSDDGFQLKVMPAKEANPHSRVSGQGTPSAPGPTHAHFPDHPAALAQPIVTLQREGDKVTGIRIACICGQVIELSCSY